MKRKIILTIITIFGLALLSGFSYGQSEKPVPREKFSAASNRLVQLSNLLKLNNGQGLFTGKITWLEWNDKYHDVFINIGNKRYDLDYSNVSDTGRAHLKDLLKKNNRVQLRAYAGGSLGTWLVIDIKQA